MLRILLIGAGGGLGSVLRYLVAGWTQRMTGTVFPIGTMVVNVIGCLCIGVLGAIVAGPNTIREELRLTLMVGVLGGFTTFSTFGLETFQLGNDGQLLRAGINVLVTNAACLAAAWIGYRMVEWFVGV